MNHAAHGRFDDQDRLVAATVDFGGTAAMSLRGDDLVFGAFDFGEDQPRHVLSVGRGDMALHVEFTVERMRELGTQMLAAAAELEPIDPRSFT